MTAPVSSPSILTFGEAMAMLVADAPGPLAEIEHFHRCLAGADNNVAIGLARLGFHVDWLTRVGDDGFGQFIRQALAAEGIGSQHTHTDSQHPTGILFKEKATGGADPKVTYFRHGSAASHLTIDDAKNIAFPALTHLHATGITPALSESCHQLTRHLMEQARIHDVSISFDPNLRLSLWPNKNVMRDVLNELASLADWVLPGFDEGRVLTGCETPEGIADFYLEHGAKAVIIKLGPEGSYYRGVISGTLESFLAPGHQAAEVVDTVGAGDGFAVGVISALLDGLSPQEALNRGNLVGTQAIQVIGDMEGLPTREKLHALEQR